MNIKPYGAVIVVTDSEVERSGGSRSDSEQSGSERSGNAVPLQKSDVRTAGTTRVSDVR